MQQTLQYNILLFLLTVCLILLNGAVLFQVNASNTILMSTIAGGGVCDGSVATNVAMYPNSVAINSHGEILIADTSFFRIRKVFLNGTITTIAGNGFVESSADFVLDARTASIDAPKAVAVNSMDEVIFTEIGSPKIRKIFTNGSMITIAGNGYGGLGSEGVLATDSMMSSPNALAIDSNDDIFYCDTNNNKIRKISNSIVNTYAGTGGQSFNQDNILAISANIKKPMAVAINQMGDVIFSDQNFRIRKVSNSTKMISTIAGTGVQGSSGDNGLASSARVGVVGGIAINGDGEVYFSEKDSSFHKVRKILANGTIITIAGNGSPGSSGDNGPAKYALLNNPDQLSITKNGDLLIVDKDNSRIRKIFASNGTIITISGPTSVAAPLYCGDGSLATNVPLSKPFDTVIDSSGDIYFTEYKNYRIRKISKSGQISLVAGNGDSTFNGDGILAVNAALKYPQGLTFNSDGNLLFAQESRIRMIFKSNSSITTIAGTLNSGYNGDNILATSASLNSPTHLFIFNREIYIADANNHRIRKIFTNGTITTIAGTGLGSFGGDNGLAVNAYLNYPSYVYVDSTGVYFADTNNHRIRKILTNGTIFTVAGNGVGSYSGDGNLAIDASLNYPSSVTKSPEGELIISDSYNQRIRKILTNGTIVTIAGNGISGNKNGVAINSQLNYPNTVTFNSNGEMIIADWSNNLLRLVSTYRFCNGIIATDLNVCNGKGSCVSMDTCQCDSTHSGNNCQFENCYGISSNDSNVCSGHGVCSKVNECTCVSNLFYGANCEVFDCFGVQFNQTNVCSSRGNCSSPNSCSCQQGYFGTNCQEFNCFGISKSNQSSCSSNGECINIDTCLCQPGWKGLNCSIFNTSEIPQLSLIHNSTNSTSLITPRNSYQYHPTSSNLSRDVVYLAFLALLFVLVIVFIVIIIVVVMIVMKKKKKNSHGEDRTGKEMTELKQA